MNRPLRLVSFAATLFAPTVAFADTTAQPLPHAQTWSNVAQIATDDDWTGVPGWTGFLGQGLTTATATDPQTVVGVSTELLDLDVQANELNPNTFVTGGAAEFHISDPTVALQGSGTADAPYLLVALNTTGSGVVRVEYDLRDVDGGADNAIQPVALQYRVGDTGDFANVPSAFVADASSGPNLATQVTSVDVVLPAAASNQPLVQLRWITSNAASNDEWIGVDNVVITDSNAPTGTGIATPASVVAGDPTTLTAVVTPGVNPVSSGLGVICNLSSIQGSASQQLFDDGTNGDLVAGDNTFTFATTVGTTTSSGVKSLDCVASDVQGRSGLFTITLTVTPVCGDGRVEGTEACDDDDNDAGDGCSATCTVESGYTCVGTAPSVCSDIDECAAGTDTCNENATCTNTPGSFGCVCNPGFTGDGFTCTEVDECGLNTDDCVASATCSNTPPGSFTCTCPTGYGGDGHTGGTGCSEIDECTAGTDNCSDDATCTNTDGSFSCECNPGFTGDGTTCTDIDECTDMTDDCSADATCTNTPGDFTCACNSGYSGDGVTCTDIDECTDMTDNCSDNGSCTNNPGGFMCACNTGFGGDGVNCTPVCGDDLIVTGETCDDGGAEGDDGCSATCQVEPGWDCAGTPSVCTEDCGDGLVVGGEECDDAGNTDGDGCDATCVEEPGWMCTGEPSTCSEEALCGDGVVDAGEECDDGNENSDDGCDATCTEETGWICNDAEPSECVEDADGDLIADDEDNCPDLANPSQADEDDDGIGDICDDTDPPSEDNGCCSTSRDSRSNMAGFALLALATLVCLRRRRRSA